MGNVSKSYYFVLFLLTHFRKLEVGKWQINIDFMFTFAL